MDAMEFDSGHSDVVNALQLDYYGRRVATASSDHTIRVFDIRTDAPTHVATLQGHTGPVWNVAWAHPKYGSLLVSCSFDAAVIVWKETETEWVQLYRSPPTVHSASVNGVAWASHEAGLVFASASSDGSVCVFECQSDGSWTEMKIPGVDAISCTSISWASPGLSDSLTDESGDAQTSMQLVVGGCENCLKILSRSANTGWRLEQKLAAHTDWILDVAWAPMLSTARPTIASVGQDGKVIVWKERAKGQWEHHIVHETAVPVCCVRWSVTGNVLAVMDAHQGAFSWKENQLTGKWTLLKD